MEDTGQKLQSRGNIPIRQTKRLVTPAIMQRTSETTFTVLGAGEVAAEMGPGKGRMLENCPFILRTLGNTVSVLFIPDLKGFDKYQFHFINKKRSVT